MINWIPVTDQRAKPSTREVLIAFKGGGYWLASYNSERDFWDGDTRTFKAAEVTHWAEITPPVDASKGKKTRLTCTDDVVDDSFIGFEIT